MNGYKLSDNSEQRKDLGLAIQTLINTNLNLLNTCFLAEIKSFKGNLICVKQAIRASGDESEFILNNIMVGFAYSGEWQTQFKLKVGDIGLCLVNNRDLSMYKQNGKSGLAATSRAKDLNDSIFLPLSLFKTLPIADCDYTIKSGDGNEITFKNSDLSINANNNIKISAKAGIEAKTDGDYSVNAKNVSVNANNAISLTANSSLTAKATSSAKIESPTTTIQSPAITLGGNVSVSGGISMGGAMASASGSPINIGTGSATLGDCFDAVFSAMDLIASGMTGQTTAPTAYESGKSALIAQIKGVVK